jgi:hypothetical protein
MGRRTVPFTEDAIVRAIKAVRKAGVEIKTVRIEPDGTIVITAGEGFTDEQLERSSRGYF